MKLNRADFLIAILKNNFNEMILDEFYIKLNEKKVQCIKLNAIDSFDFVLYTGAMYLCRKYGLILRDSIQFYTGINEYSIEPKFFRSIRQGNKNTLIKNSFSKINDFCKFKDDLLSDKIIMFYEYQGLSNFEDKVYNDLIQLKKNPSDFILFKINIPAIKELEGYFEFITHLFFNKKGFFTRNLAPFGYRGRPDFLAVDHEIFQDLIGFKLINGPCSLFSLVLLSSTSQIIKRLFKCIKPSGNYEIYVGEAKTAPKYNTNERLKSYLENKKNQIFIHNIFEINPLKPHNPNYGLLNLTSDYKISFNNREHGFKYMNTEKLISENHKWFENNIKGLLLYNLPFSKIENDLKSYDNYNMYLNDYKISDLCKDIINLRPK